MNYAIVEAMKKFDFEDVGDFSWDCIVSLFLFLFLFFVFCFVYVNFVCFILLLFFSPLIHLDKGYLNKQYIGSAVQSIYYFNTCTSSALSTGFTIVFGCA